MSSRGSLSERGISGSRNAREPEIGSHSSRRDDHVRKRNDYDFTCVAKIRAIASQISGRWTPFSASASCVSIKPYGMPVS